MPFGLIIAKYAPRLAALLAGWLVAWAAQKGLTLSADEVTVIIIAVYAFLHRFISKYINPSDAAKTELIAEGKAKVQ